MELSLSGALVYLGGTVSMTRPVDDSFGLVTIGDAENVQIYVNGQAISRTDGDGRAIIPKLSSYYDNRISFEDKDIPLDYLMPQVKLLVSPPLRSGSCINFPLTRYQAFSGTLLVGTEEATTPLANAEIKLQSPSGPVIFWTGPEGEFYLDSQLQDFDILSVQGCSTADRLTTAFFPAGTYEITVKHGGEAYQTELSLPATAQTYTELGTIILPSRSDVPLPAEQTRLQAAESPTIETASSPRTTLDAIGPDRTPPSSVALPHEPTLSAQTDTTNFTKQFIVHFPLESHTPLPSERNVLEQALRYLAEHPELPIEIEGHSCRLGSSDYNLKLGHRRAQAIRDILVTAGIRPERFVQIVSYGEDKPVCDGTSKDCLRKNRRAVVVVVVTDEK